MGFIRIFNQLSTTVLSIAIDKYQQQHQEHFLKTLRIKPVAIVNEVQMLPLRYAPPPLQQDLFKAYLDGQFQLCNIANHRAG